MKNLFVSLENAKIAKEKGFNEQVLYYYFPTGITGQTIYKLIHKDQDEGDLSLDELYKKGIFNLTYPAPLYQQVVDWLQSKGINISYSFRQTDGKGNIFEKPEHRFLLYQLIRTQTVWLQHIHIIEEDKYLGYNKAIEEALKLIPSNLE